MNRLNAPIIFYDSDCGFCNFWVQWILNKDSKNIFLFAPLGGENSTKLLPESLYKTPFHTIVLYDQNSYFTQSDAVLRITKKLPNLWKLLYAFGIIPSFIRNGIYHYISLNRKRIGLHNYCAIPTPEQQRQFLK